MNAKPLPKSLPDDANSRPRGDAIKLRLLLERDLLSDRWRSGERLPTERELCVQYRVARNTVRRALQALEDRKLIVRHVGRGTFRSDGLDAHVDPFEVSSEAFSPADVMECRLFFEPELVPLVIARATKADLDRMAECVKQADTAPSLAEFERWDGALHDAISAATHNRAAISIARSLAKVRQNAQWGILKARCMTPERQRQLQADHRAIVAALRDRDQGRARSLLRKHLLHVRAYMFGDSVSAQSLI